MRFKECKRQSRHRTRHQRLTANRAGEGRKMRTLPARSGAEGGGDGAENGAKYQAQREVQFQSQRNESGGAM